MTIKPMKLSIKLGLGIISLSIVSMVVFYAFVDTVVRDITYAHVIEIIVLKLEKTVQEMEFLISGGIEDRSGADFDSGAISSILSVFEAEHDGYLFFPEKEGAPIPHATGFYETGAIEITVRSGIDEILQAGEALPVFTGPDGVEYFAIAFTMEAAGWDLVVAVPAQTVLAPVTRIISVSMAVFIVVLAGLSMFIFWLVSSLINEAEEANRSKSNFLASMSHEIRTPLNTIIGVSQIQMQTTELPTQYKAALEKIHIAGNWLLRIINDILNLTKTEKGEAGLDLIDYDMPGEVHDMVTRITYQPLPYGKVLIVDDIETNLTIAEDLLSPYGLEIETATSGFTVIEKIENGNTYDVIFMDHMMPLMDGIETTNKLREMTYKGVIIALTANALTGNDEMFKQKGFDDFLSKPIDIRKLDAALTKYVRRPHPDEDRINIMQAIEIRNQEIRSQVKNEVKPAAYENVEESDDIQFLTKHLQALEAACKDRDETAAYTAFDLLNDYFWWNKAITAILEKIHVTLFKENDYEGATKQIRGITA